MDQKRAPSSWGRDTTPGLFWRRQNQRRETTRTVHIPSAARLHRVSSVQGKLLKLLQKNMESKQSIPPPCLLCPPALTPELRLRWRAVLSPFSLLKYFKNKRTNKKTDPVRKLKKDNLQIHSYFSIKLLAAHFVRGSCFHINTW